MTGILSLADARHIPLADETVQCCITSPPYWGLRDYGLATWEGGDVECSHDVGGQVQDNKAPGAIDSGVRPGAGNICRKCGAIRHDAGIGLEPTPEEYVANIVQVFREVKRVLRPDGTLWLNLGDSYAGSGKGAWANKNGGQKEVYIPDPDSPQALLPKVPEGLKPKDLIGIPWRVAFALQADGWYLRSDIIWAKPNPMPESVTDRPTKAHEYIFLLAKSQSYFYDNVAIAEQTDDMLTKPRQFRKSGGDSTMRNDVGQPYEPRGTRNRRSVWVVNTQPYPEAHFATYPEKLIEPCILAGTSPKACVICGAPWQRMIKREKHPTRDMEGQRQEAAEKTGRTDGHISGPSGMVDRVETVGWGATCDHDDGNRTCLVLDPFIGSGTTAAVAKRLGRSFVGFDLSAKYLALARKRVMALPEAMMLVEAESEEEAPTQGTLL